MKHERHDGGLADLDLERRTALTSRHFSRARSRNDCAELEQVTRIGCDPAQNHAEISFQSADLKGTGAIRLPASRDRVRELVQIGNGRLDLYAERPGSRAHLDAFRSRRGTAESSKCTTEQHRESRELSVEPTPARFHCLTPVADEARDHYTVRAASDTNVVDCFGEFTRPRELSETSASSELQTADVFDYDPTVTFRIVCLLTTVVSVAARRAASATRATARLLALLALSSVMACAGDDHAKPIDPATELGTLVLQLDLDHYIFSEIDYVITRAGGAARTGTFVVERATNSFRAVVGALSAYEGYLIRLSAKARDDKGSPCTCESSGLFTIVAGEASAVSIAIPCKRAQRQALSDAGESEVCPAIIAIRAVPTETTVDQIVQLHSDIAPPDPSRFSFAWTSDIGEFTNISSSQAGFRCTEPGIATIGLRISVRSGSACPEEGAFVYVTCREASRINPAGAPRAGSQAGATGGAGSTQPPNLAGTGGTGA